ncbi:hypothetical protein L484_012611 [Morus notabilis]|uniref:Uncharacterized protein n=1 Tax=Morus notabilis TaxID=981085 RepID=W9S9P0_9ROSA|nr:hypothetical protein L484_012611 [Morus notabilis]
MLSRSTRDQLHCKINVDGCKLLNFQYSGARKPSPPLELISADVKDAESCLDLGYSSNERRGFHKSLRDFLNFLCYNIHFYYGVAANSEVKEEEEDNVITCCSSSPVRCWRHDLTEVVMDNFEECDRRSLRCYFMENAKVKITVI